MKVKYKNWSINKKLLSISLSAFLPMAAWQAVRIMESVPDEIKNVNVKCQQKDQ